MGRRLRARISFSAWADGKVTDEGRRRSSGINAAAVKEGQKGEKRRAERKRTRERFPIIFLDKKKKKKQRGRRESGNRR